MIDIVTDKNKRNIRTFKRHKTFVATQRGKPIFFPAQTERSIPTWPPRMCNSKSMHQKELT